MPLQPQPQPQSSPQEYYYDPVLEAALLEQVRLHLASQTCTTTANNAKEEAVHQVLDSLRRGLLGNTTGSPTLGQFMSQQAQTEEECFQEEQEEEDYYYQQQDDEEGEQTIIPIYPPPPKTTSSGSNRIQIIPSITRPTNNNSRHNNNNHLVELFMDTGQVQRVYGLNIIHHLMNIPKKETRQYPSLIMCRLNEVGPWLPISAADFKASQRALDFVLQSKKLHQTKQQSFSTTTVPGHGPTRIKPKRTRSVDDTTMLPSSSSRRIYHHHRPFLQKQSFLRRPPPPPIRYAHHNPYENYYYQQDGGDPRYVQYLDPNQRHNIPIQQQHSFPFPTQQQQPLYPMQVQAQTQMEQQPQSVQPVASTTSSQTEMPPQPVVAPVTQEQLQQTPVPQQPQKSPVQHITSVLQQQPLQEPASPARHIKPRYHATITTNNKTQQRRVHSPPIYHEHAESPVPTRQQPYRTKQPQQSQQQQPRQLERIILKSPSKSSRTGMDPPGMEGEEALQLFQQQELLLEKQRQQNQEEQQQQLLRQQRQQEEQEQEEHKRRERQQQLQQQSHLQQLAYMPPPPYHYYSTPTYQQVSMLPPLPPTPQPQYVQSYPPTSLEYQHPQQQQEPIVPPPSESVVVQQQESKPKEEPKAMARASAPTAVTEPPPMAQASKSDDVPIEPKGTQSNSNHGILQAMAAKSNKTEAGLFDSHDIDDIDDDFDADIDDVDYYSDMDNEESYPSGSENNSPVDSRSNRSYSEDIGSQVDSGAEEIQEGGDDDGDAGGSLSDGSLSVVDEDQALDSSSKAKKPVEATASKIASGLPPKNPKATSSRKPPRDAPLSTPRTSTTEQEVDSYSEYDVGSLTGLVIRGADRKPSPIPTSAAAAAPGKSLPQARELLSQDVQVSPHSSPAPSESTSHDDQMLQAMATSTGKAARTRGLAHGDSIDSGSLDVDSVSETMRSAVSDNDAGSNEDSPITLPTEQSPGLGKSPAPDAKQSSRKPVSSSSEKQEEDEQILPQMESRPQVSKPIPDVCSIDAASDFYVDSYNGSLVSEGSGAQDASTGLSAKAAPLTEKEGKDDNFLRAMAAPTTRAKPIQDDFSIDDASDFELDSHEGSIGSDYEDTSSSPDSRAADDPSSNDEQRQSPSHNRSETDEQDPKVMIPPSDPVATPAKVSPESAEVKKAQYKRVLQAMATPSSKPQPPSGSSSDIDSDSDFDGDGSDYGPDYGSDYGSDHGSGSGQSRESRGGSDSEPSEGAVLPNERSAPGPTEKQSKNDGFLQAMAARNVKTEPSRSFQDMDIDDSSDMDVGDAMSVGSEWDDAEDAALDSPGSDHAESDAEIQSPVKAPAATISPQSPLKDKRPTNAYNQHRFGSDAEKQAHNRNVLTTMAAAAPKAVKQGRDYDVDIDDSDFDVDSDFDEQFDSGSASSDVSSRSGQESIGESNPSDDGNDEGSRFDDDGNDAPVNFGENDPFPSATFETSNDDFGSDDPFAPSDGFGEPVKFDSSVAFESNNPFTVSEGFREPTFETSSDGFAETNAFPSSDPFAEPAFVTAKPASEGASESASTGSPTPPALPLSRHNLDVTSMGGPPLKKPEAVHVSSEHSNAASIGQGPALSSGDTTAFKAVHSPETEGSSDTAPEPAKQTEVATSPPRMMSTQLNLKKKVPTPDADYNDESSSDNDSGSYGANTRDRDGNFDNSYSNRSDSYRSESPSPVSKPRPRLNLTMTRIGGPQEIPSTDPASSSSAPAANKPQQMPTQLSFRNIPTVPSPVPVRDLEPSSSEKSSVDGSGEEEDEIPPAQAADVVSSQTTLTSSTGAKLVSTQLSLKKKPPAPAPESESEHDYSASDIRDTSYSSYSENYSNSYSNSESWHSPSPQPKNKPRLNLKMTRIGPPAVEPKESELAPAPAQSEPPDVEPAESTPAQTPVSPVQKPRLNLTMSRVGPPAASVNEATKEETPATPPSKPRLNLTMTRIGSSPRKTSPQVGKKPLNLQIHRIGPPPADEKDITSSSDTKKSALRRMISKEGQSMHPGTQHSWKTSEEEASMADFSVSDVFAQGVMTEAGKAFIPSDSRRALSEGFEDYEGARQALENFKNFKENPGLKQATLTIIATVLMSEEEKEKLDEIFDALDQDKDGQLSKRDIRNGFMEFCGKNYVGEGDIRKLFWRVGQEDSEFIPYTDFMIGAADKKQMLSSESLRQAFSLLDTDRNGFIDASELLEVLPTSQDLIEKIIRKVDLDEDGKISFGEFLSMVFKSAKVDATSKEKDWLKVVKTPAEKKAVPDHIDKVDREWKYKKDPNLVAMNMGEMSPVKMPTKVIGELMAAIPKTEALGFGDDDEGVPGMMKEDFLDDSFSSGVSDNPVEMPADVMNQLKAAQSDLGKTLKHVKPEDRNKHRIEEDLPFLSELKEAQAHLSDYLKVVPEELRLRPEISERPYIRELRDAQDTVLERWRNETYSYWI